MDKWRDYLRSLIDNYGMKTKDLAERTGISEAHIINVLNNRDGLSCHYLARLIKAMDAIAQEHGKSITKEEILELCALVGEDEKYTKRIERLSHASEERWARKPLESRRHKRTRIPTPQ